MGTYGSLDQGETLPWNMCPWLRERELDLTKKCMGTYSMSRKLKEHEYLHLGTPENIETSSHTLDAGVEMVMPPNMERLNLT